VRRFHVPGLPQGGEIRLGGDEGRHLARVLRARPGDEVELFDGLGRAARAEVVTVERDAVVLAVGEPVPAREPSREVTLCSAIPKGKRMDWLVEKATEAGVARIVPLAPDRAARREAGDNTVRRWRRAALEAAKQSGRSVVPAIADPVTLDEALAATDGAQRLLASPGAAHAPTVCGLSPVAVFVGPEGGFTPDEIARLACAGAVPVGLGGLILRIETAAIVAVHALSWAPSSDPSDTAS
jgi:16S rRNA (uracil1498-N3)-methyltransferase